MWDMCTSLLKHEIGFLTPKNEIHYLLLKEWGKRDSSDFAFLTYKYLIRGKS